MVLVTFAIRLAGSLARHVRRERKRRSHSGIPTEIGPSPLVLSGRMRAKVYVRGALASNFGATIPGMYVSETKARQWL
jgi:hypothetical protein